MFRTPLIFYGHTRNRSTAFITPPDPIKKKDPDLGAFGAPCRHFWSQHPSLPVSDKASSEHCVFFLKNGKESFPRFSSLLFSRVHLFYTMSKLLRRRVLRFGKSILKTTSSSNLNCMKEGQSRWTDEENGSGHVSFRLPMIDRCRKIAHHSIGFCNFRSSFGNSNLYLCMTENRAYVHWFWTFL